MDSADNFKICEICRLSLSLFAIEQIQFRVAEILRKWNLVNNIKFRKEVFVIDSNSASFVSLEIIVNIQATMYKTGTNLRHQSQKPKVVNQLVATPILNEGYLTVDGRSAKKNADLMLNNLEYSDQPRM